LNFKVSVIVPAFNEAPNINVLLDELYKILPKDYEVIIVDDGSDDGTYTEAEKAKSKYSNLKVTRHSRNQGKTQAISWKQGKYEKKFVSSIYNLLARRIFNLKVHDINAVKAFRKEVLDDIDLRKDWHRYIVPLAAAKGYRIEEIPVQLYPRRFGKAKYQGSFRIIIGLFDLFAVGFQLTFMRKPMLYFGTYGTISIILGLVAGIVAIILRIFGHGFRPILYLVILLVIGGLLLFGFGFLGEAVATINDRLDRLSKKS